MKSFAHYLKNMINLKNMTKTTDQLLKQRKHNKNLKEKLC